MQSHYELHSIIIVFVMKIVVTVFVTALFCGSAVQAASVPQENPPIKVDLHYPPLVCTRACFPPWHICPQGQVLRGGEDCWYCCIQPHGKHGGSDDQE